MRLATVFKRLLGMKRERIVGVELVEEAGGKVVAVEVALPKRRRMFSSGWAAVRAAYDRRVVAWRHLAVFRVRCVVRCEIRRVACPDSGIRGERVALGAGGLALHPRLLRTPPCGSPEAPRRARWLSSCASTGRRSGG